MSEESHPWPQHVAKIRGRGVLGMQLYAVWTTPTDGFGPMAEQLAAHLAYQKKLEAEGVLFAAGPLADEQENEWSGEGLVIIRAANLAEARKLAAADPMHQSGARTFRIWPWLLNEGSLNVTLTYSDGGRVIR